MNQRRIARYTKHIAPDLLQYIDDKYAVESDSGWEKCPEQFIQVEFVCVNNSKGRNRSSVTTEQQNALYIDLKNTGLIMPGVIDSSHDAGYLLRTLTATLNPFDQLTPDEEFDLFKEVEALASQNEVEIDIVHIKCGAAERDWRYHDVGVYKDESAQDSRR